MNIQNRYSDNLIGYTSAGVRIDPVRDAADNTTLGHTLTAGTYYFPLDVLDDASVHVTMKWNAAFAAAITFESTDFPVAQTNQNPDVTDWSAVAGDWGPENPSSLVISSANGTGNTATALTFAAGGTNAGGGSFHYPYMCARRGRLKVIVSTGGLLRIANNAIREST